MPPSDDLIWNRVFEKFDELTKAVDGLCDRTTAIEANLATHLGEQEKKAIKKERMFYVAIAVIGTATGALGYLQDLIFHV